MLKLPPSHPSGIKKLQVGCGPHNLMRDWWNVDLRSFPGIDESMDVTEPWPWTDSIEYIYGEHFIEHLEIDRAFLFLSFANNSLKQNGRIRLTTPSLEWVLSTHFKLNSHKNSKEVINNTLSINRAFYGWGHRFLYSKDMLYVLIKSAGFDELTFCEYGKSSDIVLAGLEQHGGFSIDNGYPSVWIVEAVKSGKPLHNFLNQYAVNQNFLSHVEAGH